MGGWLWLNLGMADNQPPPTLPQPPDLYQLPIQLLEQWISLPPGERLHVLLTKQDVDHFTFAFLRLAEAQSKLEGSLVSWSHGQLADANAALAEFRRLNVEAQNNFRQFFTGLIVAALKGRTDAR
jgi:hypothetical protein